MESQCPAQYLHDNIVALISHPSIIQLLYVALEELHVWLLIAKFVHVVGNVFLCNLNLRAGRQGWWVDGEGKRGSPGYVLYLFLSHVYPSDMASLPDQLAQQVAVSATATTQVQDPA